MQKLGDIIQPSRRGGSERGRVPQLPDRAVFRGAQQLYRSGLDWLHTQAEKHFSKPFANLDTPQAGTLLRPLREAWTFDPPATRLLREVKQDIRTATLNSRERLSGGKGLYWNPLD